MKAIETKWKGWRFRSRTEARWAVFLEALGVGFVYEPEGYLLPSGPYLPDFRITDVPGVPAGCKRQHAFLEIKPEFPTNGEQTKAIELARASGLPVMIAVGVPDYALQVMLFEAIEPFDELLVYKTHVLGFAVAPDGALVLGRGPLTSEQTEADQLTPEEPLHPRLQKFDEDTVEYRQRFCRVLGAEGGRRFGREAANAMAPNLRKAYDAARSARFEFGQTDKRWDA